MKAAATLARKSGSAMKGYSKLDLGSLSVAVGDSVIVNEASDPETLATVVGIVGSPESIDSSFLRVRWFYKPRELFITIPKAIGKHEVFDSDNFQNISVLSISGKVQVVSFLDYFNMRSPGENIYYCRSWSRLLASGRAGACAISQSIPIFASSNAASVINSTPSHASVSLSLKESGFASSAHSRLLSAKNSNLPRCFIDTLGITCILTQVPAASSLGKDRSCVERALPCGL